MGIDKIVVFLIIMLIFAGPKRMIKWAYTLGVYTTKFRAMYQETMGLLQKEIEAAGVDLPKATTVLKPFDVVGEVNKVLNLDTPVGTATASTPALPAQSPTVEPASAPSLNPTEPQANAGDQQKYDAWTPKQ